MLSPGSIVNETGEKVSPYLLCQPRILREVCRAKSGDDNGRRCFSCSVRDFCETQAARTGWAD
jgi:hypothetical protein